VDASPRLTLVTGVVLVLVGGFFAAVFALATVLVANPCGTFGDECDEYGTLPPEFFVMLAMSLLALAAVVVGLWLVVRGLRRR